jgi:hypothetical protein
MVRVTSIVHFLISSLVGIISILTLFLIDRYPTTQSFTSLLALAILTTSCIISLIARNSRDKLSFLSLSICTIIAFSTLLLVIEQPTIRQFIVVTSGIAMYTIVQHILHVKNKDLIAFELKPFRRMVMMIITFQAFAFSSFIFALNLFFPEFEFWIAAILQGIIFSLLAFEIWRMYFDLPFRRGWLWYTIVGFTMVELVWVIHLLPFGYLISGFIVTWLWYIMQLFIRFHLSVHRINWKKQRIFLLVNTCLFIFFMLFFVRWI